MNVPEPFVHVLGWTLLHFVWQGMLAAVALGFVLLLVPAAWARIRYVLACTTLAAMGAMPVATALWFANAGPPQATDAFSGIAALTTASAPEALANLAAVAPAAASAPADWLPWFVAAWIVGVMICSLRLAGGWWQARRLLRVDTLAANAGWAAVVERVARQLHVERPIRILQSARIQVPIVIGSLRPVLLLPAALTGLTPQQIEAIVAHELAHIRRHDYLVNLVQSAIETLLFYHPAVWWVSHTIRVEREHCCDDLAVSACGDPLLYARALTTIETLRHEQVATAMAASGGSLLSRVRRLLGVRPPARVAGSGWVIASITALMVAGAGAIGWIGGIVHLWPEIGTVAAERAATTPSGAHAVSRHLGPAVASSAEQGARVIEAEGPVATLGAEDIGARARELSEPGPLEEADAVEVQARTTERRAHELQRMSRRLEELARAAADRQARVAAKWANTFKHRALQEQARAVRGQIRALERHGRDLQNLARQAASIGDSARELAQSHALKALTEAIRTLEAQRGELLRHSRELQERARELSHSFEPQANDDVPPPPPPPPAAPGPAGAPAPTAPSMPPDSAHVPPVRPDAPAPTARAVPAPPAAAAPPPPSPPPTPRRESVHTHESTWSISQTRDDVTLQLSARGRVTFAEDGTDVTALEEGGHFMLEKRSGGSARNASRFEARRVGGTIERRYLIDGRPAGEPEGRKWLAATLPDVIREFALDSEGP